MKIYKYREIANHEALERFERIVRHGVLWCARPDTLNDPHEFAWTCDFTQTPRTLAVLAGLLQRTKGDPPAEALRKANVVLASGTLESFARPVIKEMIGKI